MTTVSTLSRELAEHAKSLVNTSVEDMQSGLWFYTSSEHLQILRTALMIVNKRGEKTKSRILKSKIKKLEKSLDGAVQK
jgi:hypothetical protein